MRKAPPTLTPANEAKPSPKRTVFSSIQGRLFILILLVLVPLLLFQTHFFYDRYQYRRGVELQANLELARAVGRAFDAFVKDVLRQELAIGITATASPPLSPTDFTRLLDLSVKDSPAVRAFSWVSPQGLVLASSNPEAIGVDVSDRAYFKETVSGREWLVTDLLGLKLKSEEGKPFFGIVRSIRDEKGSLRGMVVASIAPEDLDDVLAVERSKDAGVSLVDSKGIHVYRYPFTEYTWEQRNWLKMYPVINDVLGGKEIAVTVSSGVSGKKRLTGFAPVSSIGWIAAASRAEDVAVGPIISAILKETGTILFVAIASLLAAFGVSRTITTAVKTLQKHAHSLGRGEIESPVIVFGSTELEDLASTFNLMAERVQSREEALRESEKELLSAKAEAERRAREAEEGKRILDALMNCIPEGITIASAPDVITTHTSSYAQDLLARGWDTTAGFSMEEWLAGVEHYLPDCTAPACVEDLPLWRTIKYGETIMGQELMLRNPKGYLLPVLCNAGPIRDRNGAIIGGVVAWRDITERKRAEEALRENERKYRELVQNANSAIVRWKSDGTITFFNEYAQSFFGYREDEVIGRHVNIFVPERESDGRDLTVLVQDIVNHPERYAQSINENICRDGSRVWMAWTNKPIFGENGGVTEILSVGTNITERKRAEAEREILLQEVDVQRARLQAILDSLPVGVWITDAAGKMLVVNDLARDIWGGEAPQAENVQGYEVYRAWWADTGELITAEDMPLARAIRGEMVKENAVDFERFDGKRATMVISAAPVQDSEGKLIGGVAIVQDITRLKKAEEELKRAYDRLYVTLESITDGFLSLDREWRYTYFNETGGRLVGMNREELIGGVVWELFPHAEGTKFYTEYHRAVETNTPVHFEEFYPEPLNLWLECHCYPSEEGLSVFFRDVSERKRAEKEREQRITALNTLIQVGSDAIASESMQELLDKVVDAARLLTRAKIGTSGHGYRAGDFRVGATSKSEDSPPCPPGSLFTVEKGGIYLDLIDRADSVRLTHEELLSHPLWWGLPEGHTPLHGLLGARLTDRDGKASGLIMVSQKEEGDFTKEDELLLKQLASIASIGLQHLEAREALVKAHDELEQRVRDRTEELTGAYGVLDRQREVLQTIIDNIPVMLCFYDPSGRVELASKELERLLGWSLEDMRREDFDIMAECYPDPEYRKMVWDFMMEAVPGWRDFTIRTRSGAILENSWANVRLSDGSRIGIGLDITERKRAEQALKESEERFRLITETIQDVFWISTPGVGKMLYVSPAYERIWGRTRESLYSEPQSFFETIHPEDKALALSHVPEHAEGNKYECQYRIIQPDGDVRWILDRGFPIREENGSLRFMTGVATDITDRKRTEEELALFTRKLQESNQALQDFASIASHDMQEPLRKVKSFGNMLKQKCGEIIGEAGNNYLNRMLNATDRMQTLLTSLLEYSRVTSRAEPFQEVELVTLIREVLSDLEVRIENTGGRVELGELPSIVADPTQMRQLFQNLIGNALKFHKEGEKPVVRVHCSPDDLESYVITVEDDGIGFDERYLERIFAPFQRLHGRSAYEGAGMGLAICRKIVERHGGTITARSEPGCGAMFIIKIPR